MGDLEACLWCSVADELHALFLGLGKDLKRGTIANLIRLADDDGNGTLEWEEFSQIFEVVARMMEKAAAKAKAAALEPVAAPAAKADGVTTVSQIAMGA